MNQKGFAIIIFIIVIIALTGTGLYFAFSRKTAPTPPTTTSPSPSSTTTTTAPTSNPEPTKSIKPASPTSQSSSPKIVQGHSSAGKSIKVTLVHDQSNPHALNDNFVITGATHVSIALYYAPYADGGSETILRSQDFTNIDKLPFLFEISGNLDGIFKERTGYYLEAKVFDHPGSEVVVGDLISEISTPITSSDTNIEIKVFGIEECGSLNAGGFCTTKK